MQTGQVDSRLKALLPQFIARCERDSGAALAALDAGDYDTIFTLGHRLTGAGGAYGFDDISEIGRGLQRAARGADAASIRELAQALMRRAEEIRG
ncbi:hypothetical protein DSM104443_01748 [Usitatibacter rugosus]|uniref:HPt domain-containing protein n=1 Tax=Usitatibacter rugosus TaxID=2732067 RepID=A0A6M4GTQ3_9PROT|nr:Hpt domain-containing protein [Usitatibacter rugosus]QJR10681.1 hypothetical protein DSM104443_01748 [Usitatibacter rugosus]